MFYSSTGYQCGQIREEAGHLVQAEESGRPHRQLPGAEDGGVLPGTRGAALRRLRNLLQQSVRLNNILNVHLECPEVLV